VFLERDDALLRNARQGQIFVDHTTTDVETARECAAQAARRGATYLDCPISGSPDTAAAGTLTLMCGGDQDAFHRVLALLRLYGENVQHMGGSGSGAATKIICQSLVAMHTVAAAEAVSMAGAMGVDDMSKVFNVVDASWGASTMLRRCSPLMERYTRNPEMTPDPSPTSIDTVLRDIRLIGQTTELRPEAFPVFAKTHNIFARASTAGVGDRDIAGVVHFLESDGPADPLAAPDAPALAASSGSSSSNAPHGVAAAGATAVSAAAGAAAGAASISAEALMDSLGGDVAGAVDVTADNAICDVAEAQNAAAASSQPALEEELEFY
jgi:3-hydroxyisobutyrate dehydrogenase-like beta-hydroxyacid dehydrogenase